MKKARFTETQIIGILKEADVGTPVKENLNKKVCEKIEEWRNRPIDEAGPSGDQNDI